MSQLPLLPGSNAESAQPTLLSDVPSAGITGSIPVNNEASPGHKPQSESKDPLPSIESFEMYMPMTGLDSPFGLPQAAPKHTPTSQTVDPADLQRLDWHPLNSPSRQRMRPTRGVAHLKSHHSPSTRLSPLTKSHIGDSHSDQDHAKSFTSHTPSPASPLSKGTPESTKDRKQRKRKLVQSTSNDESGTPIIETTPVTKHNQRKKRPKVEENEEGFEITADITPKSKNVFAQPAITIHDEANLSIAELVSLRAQVKKEARSVGAPIKDSAVFSPAKTADAYSTTSQKVSSARTRRHEMMKDPNDAAMIRAQGRDRSAVFQARTKFKSTEEYQDADADLRIKLLDQVRDGVLVERFNSGESAEFMDAQRQQMLRHAAYKAEMEENLERTKALASLRHLRGEGEAAKLRDGDSLDQLTRAGGEFPAEEDPYQKSASRMLTVTVKRFEREAWLHGMRDLADAGDPDPAHSMQVFRSQVLDPDHIEDPNELYPYPPVQEQVLEGDASTVAGSQAKTVATEGSEASNDSDDLLSFVVENIDSSDESEDGTGDSASFVQKHVAEFLPEENDVHTAIAVSSDVSTSFHEDV